MRTLLSLLSFVSTLSASPILFAISGDSFGIPRQLVQIDLTGQSAAPVVLLGDGSYSFAGGLAATGPVTFTGIRNDSGGNAELVSFLSGGQVSPVNTLLAGWFGGLALRSGIEYWIRNDALGDAYLESSLGTSSAIGTGFTGGLAYRPEDGLFYAIGNDFLGNSTLYSISGGGAVAALPLTLGGGFYGGLAWDSASGYFYAIASDPFANSTLYRFAPGDITPTQLFALGQGYLHAALTVGLSDPAVPEPAGWMLAAAGIAALGAGRRRGTRKRLSDKDNQIN